MKKLLSVVIVFACIFTGCTRFDEPIPEPESENTAMARTRSGGGSQAFEKLPNPYALDVMPKKLRV